MRKLILRSVSPWLVKNHAKLAKIEIPIRNLCGYLFFGVEKRNVGNHPKRVLAKFGANPSHVRRVTEKFSSPTPRR